MADDNDTVAGADGQHHDPSPDETEADDLGPVPANLTRLAEELHRRLKERKRRE